ncbi:MAG: sterol desaturase/sphingolipid hydroxylase (fatty acid hydroxylase superfamily) [Candidatus Marinamargulisbacteria bacterium]|jgi:sterol desaturase/sphingolipid hydroxylase (fatty acid hydroxylase superfamily)
MNGIGEAGQSLGRLLSFGGVFVVMALWELVSPRRKLTASKPVRWANNLIIILLDNILVKVLFPVSAVGFAMWVQQQGWGLLNLVSFYHIVEIVVAVVILDCIIYGQHVVFHLVGPLWALHRMHHTDTDLDVTSGIRFHPLEILISMGVKFAAIAVVGVSPMAAFVFELILNGTAMFNHSNIHLPRALDAMVRKVLVTPDMHRVHHSIYPEEYNNNFGFNFPWWDHLFGTYTAQPKEGHRKMSIGLKDFRSKKDMWATQLLIQPFRKGDVPPSKK